MEDNKEFEDCPECGGLMVYYKGDYICNNTACGEEDEGDWQN